MLRKATIISCVLAMMGAAGLATAETGVVTSQVFSLNTLEIISGVEDGGAIPAVFGLEACYPNPFNPTTTIKFRLADSGPVTLAIFDLKGRLVRTLISNVTTESGDHEAVWNGKNDDGRIVAGGVYLCRLKAGNFVANERMTLLK